MSLTEHTKLLSGWGRTRRTRVTVEHPRTPEQVTEALAAGRPGGLIARGAGRSYGDAAQNGAGTVLDMTSLCGAPRLDTQTGETTVAAGTTFGDILLRLARAGWTLPVVPGTKHLTVGGAIAADIHGKNHPVAGSFAKNLMGFTLCTPARGTLRVSPESEPDVFEATVGGMGLTGVITAASIRAVPMRSSESVADVDRVASLEDAMALMSEPSAHSHSIAWLDLLDQGRSFGRAVVTRSSEARTAVLADTKERPGEHRSNALGQLSRRPTGANAAPFAERPALDVPGWFPSGLLRPSTVRAFNAAHWRSTPRSERGRILGMSAQLFPLDVLGDWNRLYGAGGLVQYQFAVPDGSASLVREIPELLRRRRLPMYLAVLKRFGAYRQGMLSFPQTGWTVAIDLPARAPGLTEVLREADELLVSSGGRLYLAKDARMAPEIMAASYPELGAFRDVCARLDPEGVLASDMARRLELRP